MEKLSAPVKTIACLALALSVALGTSVSAQSVSVPQVDRGAASYVPQFQTTPDTTIQQLPDSARPLPRPQPASQTQHRQVSQTFVFADVSSPLPPQWEEVSDLEPLAAHENGGLKATVGSGPTVIFTPQAAAALPTVGSGAIMR